jgi:LuxR family transcriptional regulator, maltose regulon positive regulatory protein
MPDGPARNRGRRTRQGSGSIAPAGGWLGAPPIGALHVRRPRLLQRLEAAEERPLILVSAPAGYGKTSLVADWVSTRGTDERTAWVTFEEHDQGFWHGFVSCLQSMGVETSADGFSHTGSGVERRVLTSLASLVAGQGPRVRVVIDGYDVVSDAVGRDLDFLLRHSGHRLQLVLLTRSDPVMPLYRYRLDDNIEELRMRDLAFTDDEAAELFASAGVELEASSVTALNQRTEGWPVGLRFAGAMLRERVDTDAAVAEVVGDTGNIAEYLVAEVLEVQRPEIRQLLLRTSIPDTVRPGLDVALGGASAAHTLSLLTRENAFVDQVPGHPGCHRYHPFFRDLLRATLSYEDPQELDRLHRVAAAWFADRGETGESVRQLAAIDAWDEAAGRVVVDGGIGDLLLHGPAGAVRTRLVDMPSTTPGPAAALVRAALSLTEGDTDRTARELAHAQQAIGPARTATDADAEVALSVLDALRARNDDAPGTAVQLAERAATALASTNGVRAEADPSLVGLIGTSRGIAAIRLGDLSVAESHFEEVAVVATPADSVLAAEADGFLALLACFGGRLSHAAAAASRARAAAERIGLPAAECPAGASLALAWVAVEHCDLPAAVGHAALAGKQQFLGGDPVSRTILTLIRSRIEAARGHLPRALSIVQSAIAEAPADGWSTDVLHLEAARVALTGGKPGPVAEHLTRVTERDQPAALLLEAQLAIARGDDLDLDGPLATLQLSPALHVQVGGLLATASAHLRRGSAGRARVAVDRALRLAAGENLRRSFHEADPEVRQLLLDDASLLARHPWLGPGERASAASRPRSRPLKPVLEDEAPVLEELTPRELEVLGRLAELLTTEEIAETLFVSVNTVRTHVRSILRKLGVPRRNAAVRRARELDLIAS